MILFSEKSQITYLRILNNPQYPGEQRTAGNSRDATENTRKLEAVFRSGISTTSSAFRQDPSGNHRKNPGNSRPPYPVGKHRNMEAVFRQEIVPMFFCRNEPVLLELSTIRFRYFVILFQQV